MCFFEVVFLGQHRCDDGVGDVVLGISQVFTPFSSVSIVDFEQVNVSWDSIY